MCLFPLLLHLLLFFSFNESAGGPGDDVDSDAESGAIVTVIVAEEGLVAVISEGLLGRCWSAILKV